MENTPFSCVRTFEQCEQSSSKLHVSVMTLHNLFVGKTFGFDLICCFDFHVTNPHHSSNVYDFISLHIYVCLHVTL